MSTSEWIVKPCTKYLSATVHGFRVQRPCSTHSKCSGFEMAFAHDSEELCERVARVLNEWEKQMPEAKDLFYHGVRQQIGRVLKAMGEDRISQGLTAFENGASTWTACFFARAYPEVNLTMGDPELKIAELLGMPGNKVPMRIVYRTFDGVGFVMTKKSMQEFIRGFLDEQRDPSVQAGIDDLLKQVKFEGAEERAIDFAECAVVNEKPGWMERDWSPGSQV